MLHILYSQCIINRDIYGYVYRVCENSWLLRLSFARPLAPPVVVHVSYPIMFPLLDPFPQKINILIQS